MKRYVLFAGRKYYPEGGWADFQSDHDTLDDALAAGKAWVTADSFDEEEAVGYLWWHVIDTDAPAQKFGDNAYTDDKRGLVHP